MRPLALSMVFVCAAWTAHAASTEPPDEFHVKVLEERADGQWHGRQHWLYDEESQPQTDARASKTPDCTDYRIRVPKAGAGTEIKRIQKCD